MDHRGMPLSTAPLDGTEIEVLDECGEWQAVVWSDGPVCLGGPPHGCYPAGWATGPSSGTDLNLPLNVTATRWRPLRNLPARLQSTTERMAAHAKVGMSLWDEHSNAVLEASREIERLYKEIDEMTASREREERMRREEDADAKRWAGVGEWGRE